MSCYSEKNLEQVILEATPVTDEMYRHLISCDQCRELFLFLSGWQELYLAGQTTALSTTGGKAMMLQPLNMVELRGRPIYRLAAQGEQPTELYLVRSFTSPEHGVVGRLLQERTSKHAFLYLIADYLKSVQTVKVELEGTELQGITDMQGVIDFGVQPLLNCTAMRIRSPQAVFELSEHLDPLPITTQKHSFLVKNEFLDELQIEIDKAGEHCLYQLRFKRGKGQPPQNLLEVVAVTDRRTIREEIRQGVSVIETAMPEKLLRVQIY